MTENMKAIIAAVSEDDELKAQAAALMGELAAASDGDRPEVVSRIIALAGDRGFALTEEDLVIEAPAEGQIVDEELAAVSGGCGSKDKQVYRSAWPNPNPKHGGWC